MATKINYILIVVITTLVLICIGSKLTDAAKNLEQASINRMAKIDSIFENN